MRRRFVFVFFSSFIIIFGILNYRFVGANIRYFVAPGTIVTKDSLKDAVRLLPLAKDVFEKPLPDSAHLVIDSIGVNAPIVFGVPTNNDAIYQQLENGVVHYASTPKPGTRTQGLSIILGHSSAYPWYRGKYGSVFALLNKLKSGDRFYIQYSDGRLFVYAVKEAIVFNPFNPDDPRLAEVEKSEKPTLVLVSCWPVGTNYRRIAVVAELVQN